MNLQRLRTFLAVLEHGKFSEAAAALRLRQSTVSFQMKSLETSVGAKLLDRHGGGLRPTPSGRLLRRYAVRIVALADEASASVRAQELGHRGRVTVAASTIPAEYLLPPVLVEFRRQWPKIAVVIEVSDSETALARLLSDDCDLALIGERPRDRRVVARVFAEDDIILVGPTPNPFAPRGRLTWDELAAAPLILRERGSGTRAALSRTARSTGLGVESDTTTWQIGSNEAIKSCVRGGAGLAFLSRRAAASDLAEGRLEMVSLPGPPIRRSFFSATLRGVTASAGARALLLMLHRIR
jgi:DNA-binding transcriptional LysR family regulator